jgi:hypothetical protein
MADREVVVVNSESNGLGLAGLIFSSLGWLTCGLLCIPGAVLSLLGLFSKGPKGHAVAGLIVGFPGVAFFVLFGAGIILTLTGIGGAVNAAKEIADARRSGEQSMADSQQPKADVLPAVPDDNNEIVTQLNSTERTEPTTQVVPEPKPTATLEGFDSPDNAQEAKPSADAAEPVAPAAEKSPQPSQFPKNDPAELYEPEPIMIPELKVKSAEPYYREFIDVTGKFRIRAQFLKVVDGKAKLKKEDGSEIDVPLERLSATDRGYIDLMTN